MTFETFDQSDEETWPENIQIFRKFLRTKLDIFKIFRFSENFQIFEKKNQILTVTFEIFDQSDEETWPDQHFYIFNNSDHFYNLNNFNLVFQFWQLTTIDDHFHNSDNCFCHFNNWKNNPGDLWDTDYNSDNWEPEFMTIFVTWQLIVTLDSIRNSCDVCNFRFLV